MRGLAAAMLASHVSKRQLQSAELWLQADRVKLFGAKAPK
jgi:hypothetical protein